MIRLEKYTHEIADNYEDVRLTYRVINQDQTGFMGHMVVPKELEQSFWSGAEVAIELANDSAPDLKTTDYAKLYDEETSYYLTDLAFRLGVKAVFNTWQPRIGNEDKEYIAHRFFTYQAKIKEDSDN